MLTTIVTGEANHQFTAFVLIIRPAKVSYRVLFKFGLETDQFFDQPPAALSHSSDETASSQLVEWLLQTGLAWILIAELNLRAASEIHNSEPGLHRQNSSNGPSVKWQTFQYRFGRDALASLILAMRQAKNPGELLKNKLSIVPENDKQYRDSESAEREAVEETGICSCDRPD